MKKLKVFLKEISENLSMNIFNVIIQNNDILTSSNGTKKKDPQSFLKVNRFIIRQLQIKEYIALFVLSGCIKKLYSSIVSIFTFPNQ